MDSSLQVQLELFLSVEFRLEKTLEVPGRDGGAVAVPQPPLS